MQGPKLFLMFGYPGAGKTTSSKIIAKETGAVHLSSDELRIKMFPQPKYTQDEHDAVYEELDRQTEALLRESKGVVYDANLNRYQHRLEKYEMSEHTHAKPILLWVKVPRQLARDRAVLRGHHHLVPEDETFETMFDRVASGLEEPREDEPLYIINGVDQTESEVKELLARL
jgi:hypothetical protein